MIISHKYQYIHLKNRKVGGTSLEKYLYENFFDEKTDILTFSADGLPNINIDKSVSGHVDWREIKNLIGCDIFNTYEKFCVERNPWEKTVSNYYFHLNMIRDFSGNFEDFLLNYPKAFLSDYQRYTHIDGSIMMNHVIQYNQLDKIQTLFRENLNLPFDINQYKKYTMKAGLRPKNEHYSELYNNNTQDLVERHFIQEIEKFNYKFENNKE